jgi:hypothetical protein
MPPWRSATRQLAERLQHFAFAPSHRFTGDVQLRLGYRAVGPTPSRLHHADAVALFRRAKRRHAAVPQLKQVTYQSVVEAMAARNTSYTRGVEAETAAREVRVQIISGQRETVVVPCSLPAPPPSELKIIHDFQGVLIRETAKAVLQHLDAIARDLAGHRDIGAIVEAMSDDEQDRFRKGVEAVAKLKAAMDTNIIRFPH